MDSKCPTPHALSPQGRAQRDRPHRHEQKKTVQAALANAHGERDGVTWKRDPEHRLDQPANDDNHQPEECHGQQEAATSDQ